MTDENYEARAQAHLASLKRDMKASMEDAVVRAMHKVMAEFEAKSDERLMEDWGPGPHEHHSLPARGPEQPAQRCPLCNYQHGHAIGCKNNPVDIALDKMAENARELGLDYDVKSDHRLMNQPAQQEPVAWATQLGEYAHIQWGAKRPEYPMVYEFPLYTRPQAREPLTDEQIEAIHQSTWIQSTATLNDFARAIEAAHGIKENT